MSEHLDVKKMKVADLRAELEKRSIDSSGLKVDLQQRLQLALDEEEFGVGPTAAATEPTTLVEIAQESENPTSEPENPVVPVDQPETETEDLQPEETPEETPGQDEEENEKTNAETVDVAEEKENMESADVSEAAEVSEENKRIERAKRFGIEPSLEQKKMERAKRFNLPVNDEPKTGDGIDPQILKKRAKRFGLPDPEEEEMKKRARAERFGAAQAKVAAEELQRRTERAKRFGMPLPEDDEAKKAMRAARFA